MNEAVYLKNKGKGEPFRVTWSAFVLSSLMAAFLRATIGLNPFLWPTNSWFLNLAITTNSP